MDSNRVFDFLIEQDDSFVLDNITEMREYCAEHLLDFLPNLYQLNERELFKLRRNIWENSTQTQLTEVMTRLKEVNNKKPKDKKMDVFAQGEFFDRYYQDYLCAILCDLYLTDKTKEKDIIEFVLEVGKKMDVASESTSFAIFTWKNFTDNIITLSDEQKNTIRQHTKQSESQEGLSPQFGIFFIFQLMANAILNEDFFIPAPIKDIFSEAVGKYIKKASDIYINPYYSTSYIDIWEDIFDSIVNLEEKHKYWLYHEIKNNIDKDKLSGSLELSNYKNKDELLGNIYEGEYMSPQLLKSQWETFIDYWGRSKEDSKFYKQWQEIENIYNDDKIGPLFDECKKIREKVDANSKILHKYKQEDYANQNFLSKLRYFVDGNSVGYGNGIVVPWKDLFSEIYEMYDESIREDIEKFVEEYMK